MSEPLIGSASIDIHRPIANVFAVVSDLRRMGDWSPESGAVRWLDGFDGPRLGGRFAGENEIRLGPVPVKRWTTESEITAFDPPRTFEFVAAGLTTWRFDLEEIGGGTTLTESFSFPPPSGFEKVSYNLLGARDRRMLAGVERTLEAIKRAVEK